MVRNDAANAVSRLHSVRHRLQLAMGRTANVHGFDVTGSLRRDADHLDLKLQIAQGRIDYTVGTQFHRQQSPTGTGSSIGVFLSLPLPVFSRNQGETERARLEQRQLVERLRALRSSVAAEVESSYEQYALASTVMNSIEAEMLEQSRQIRRNAEESYRTGKISLLEFLDAQRACIDTIQGYSDARASHARSLYTLESVTGKSVAVTSPRNQGGEWVRRSDWLHEPQVWSCGSTARPAIGRSQSTA